MDTENVIICRSLRHLDALVAEKLMGWHWVNLPEHPHFGPQLWPDVPSQCNVEILAAAPDISLVKWAFQDALPAFTTWPGLKPVIRNREEAGYQWDLGFCDGLDWPDNYSAKLIVPGTTESFTEYADTAPVAFCLAALASAGCRIKFESTTT